MVSDQETDSNNVINETVKIPELVFVLSSVIHPNDMKKVEEVLVSRENRLNEEIQHWKNEFAFMEEKQGETSLNYIVVEKELRKCKRHLDEVLENATRLQEDQKLLEKKAMVFEDRVKRARTKYEKLVEDNKRLERENKKLSVMIRESGFEKVKLERELESEKRKSVKNELRVCRLEDKIQEFLEMSREVEEEKSFTDVGVEVKEVILNGNGEVNSSRGVDFEDDEDFGIHPCNEGHTILERGQSSLRDRRQINTSVVKTNPGVVNAISDSDDEMPTQNPALNTRNIDGPNVEQPVSGNESTLENQRQGELFVDIGRREEVHSNIGFTVSSSSSESCDSDTINEILRHKQTKSLSSDSE